MLRHANIMTAYSATRLGENILFAMEYVDGLDLSRMVKARGPLPIIHACYLARSGRTRIAARPRNGHGARRHQTSQLMLTSSGDRRIIKILDFGLAKATREQKVDGGLPPKGSSWNSR